jgi:Dolichyl-phosphate-mannose-protein mannosyltransferase
MGSGPARASALPDQLRAPAGGGRRAAWSVALILLAVYTATFTGLPDVPDSEAEFQTTSALVRNGSLALEGTPEARALAETGFGVAPGAGRGAGRVYSRYGVGQALGGVPFYLAGRALALVWPQIEQRHAASEAYGYPRSEYFAHLLVGWRNSLLSALTGLLIVLTAARLGASTRCACLGGLSYGLCTFAWPQARSTLSDVQATFLLFAAFHLLVKAREQRKQSGAFSPWSLSAAGVALGGALLTRIAVLPAVLVLGAVGWGLVRSRSVGDPRAARRALLPLIAPLLAGAAVLVALNVVRFGHPLRTGYEAALDPDGFFVANPLPGLAGLMVSPGRGLLWMAPGLLLLPIALRAASRVGETFWICTLAAIAFAVVVPTAFLRGWHGAWTFGPRYLLPLLPFAWVGIALALESSRERRAVWFGASVLFAAGFVVQLGAALVDHATHTDLGLQAARVEWPDEPGIPLGEQEERRFERLQWNWRFAAPLAHWRIFSQRVARTSEPFSARSLYSTREDAVLTVTHDRERGFRHLAWVDLAERLGGPRWPGFVLCGLLGALGLALGYRAREARLD